MIMMIMMRLMRNLYTYDYVFFLFVIMITLMIMVLIIMIMRRKIIPARANYWSLMFRIKKTRYLLGSVRSPQIPGEYMYQGITVIHLAIFQEKRTAILQIVLSK